MKEYKMLDNVKNLERQSLLYSEDNSFNYSAYLYRYRYEVVRENINGPDILEVGIGYGDISKWLSEEKTFNILSIDGSISNIQRAKEKCNSDNIDFQSCLFEEFESDKYFDDILITNSLEHIEHPIEVLLNMQNYLKDNGRIHITVPNAMSAHRQLGRLMGMIKYEWSLNTHDLEVGHKRVYTFELLKEHIRYAELKISHIDGIIFKPFSNSQMNELLKLFEEKVIDGLFLLGRKYPNLAAEIYMCCRKHN
jgi:2-polyprenyl-3-methyl-5-hydroxy-6-metoxy-1,4-benzoquinol methylase